jgi:hypothetical protein
LNDPLGRGRWQVANVVAEFLQHVRARPDFPDCGADAAAKFRSTSNSIIWGCYSDCRMFRAMTSL